jgi:serine/threonine protein kinase
MAPEQVAGDKEVGPAADMYGLGAILYECLTRRPPFEVATQLETLDMVRSREPVEPRLPRLGLLHDLATICLKCLGKDPARRYAWEAALADDLERWLAGAGATLMPREPPSDLIYLAGPGVGMANPRREKA